MSSLHRLSHCIEAGHKIIGQLQLPVEDGNDARCYQLLFETAYQDDHCRKNYDTFVFTGEDDVFSHLLQAVKPLITDTENDPRIVKDYITGETCYQWYFDSVYEKYVFDEVARIANKYYNYYHSSDDNQVEKSVRSALRKFNVSE